MYGKIRGFVIWFRYKIFLEEKRLITPEGLIMSHFESEEVLPIKDKKPQSQPSWDHEEQALLVTEYFYYKNSLEGERYSNLFISKLLRKRGLMLGISVGEKYRNLRGIEMQRENLSHFDRESRKKITGHESKWMQSIMDEYYTNPEALKREAYEMIKKYALD